MNTEKIDFKKSLPSYSAKSGRIELIKIPKMQYLMIDGKGDPNTSVEYSEAIQTLYPVAYKLKFASKLELGKDYVVPPLEGLWWAEDFSSFTTKRDKSKWYWTMMIMVPDWITKSMFKEALAKAAGANPLLNLSTIRLETLKEGKCVQTLHRGSFDEEAEVLAEIHDDFIPSNGLQFTGKHHEIYFSDSRKVSPDKFRTILRQPVK